MAESQHRKDPGRAWSGEMRPSELRGTKEGCAPVGTPIPRVRAGTVPQASEWNSIYVNIQLHGPGLRNVLSRRPGESTWMDWFPSERLFKSVLFIKGRGKRGPDEVRGQPKPSYAPPLAQDLSPSPRDAFLAVYNPPNTRYPPVRVSA